MTQILFGVIAIAAGIAASFQSAANAGLSARIGLAAALVVNTSVVLVATIAFYLTNGRSTAFFTSGAPWYLYLGGVGGFVVILSLAFLFPKIGAALAIALLVLGQGVAALAIDHFGLLGMPQVSVTLTRVGGLLLVGGGIALLRL
jgi:transporter family-2 protein